MWEGVESKLEGRWTTAWPWVHLLSSLGDLRIGCAVEQGSDWLLGSLTDGSSSLKSHPIFSPAKWGKQ